MKSQIKIMYVFGQLRAGGYESFIMNIVRNIDLSKYELVFLNYTSIPSKRIYDEEISKKGINVIKINDNRFKNPVKFASDIHRVIKDEHVDIVHSHVDAVSGLVLFAVKLAGVKTRIAHSHNTGLRDENKFSRKIVFAVLKKMVRKFATVKLACGEDAGKFLFGIKSNFTLINNGIDLSRFEYDEDNRKNTRSELGIGNNDKVLLHIGRFETEKNHVYLLDILREIMNVDKHVRMILIGEGNLKNSIIAKTEEYHLENNVSFLSGIYDIERYYSASDLFVFPSLYEGLPFVLVEAQANGIPCLISDTIDKKVKMSDNIEILPINESPEIWARKIHQIQNGRCATAISDELKEYDVKQTVGKLLDIYDESLKDAK